MKIRIDRNFLIKLIISISIFYALFAFNRIKALGGLTVNERLVGNETVIYGVLIILIIPILISKKINISFLLYIFYILITGVYSVLFMKISFVEVLISVFLILIPLLYFLLVKSLNEPNISKLMSILILFNAMYVLLAIFSVTNYNFLANLIGIKSIIDDEYRSSLMLGSSITVSYYFIISIPLITKYLYMHRSVLTKKRMILGFLLLALNIIAVVILKSRAAFYTLIIIGAYYLLFLKGIKLKYRLLVIIFLITVTIIFTRNYNLARLFVIFNDDSISGRFNVLNIGLDLIGENILFGTGLSKYFLRYPISPFIQINGITTLVDPHNLFILYLSETGILGCIVLIPLILELLRRIFQLNYFDKHNTIVFIISTIMLSLGGSQLLNEINFSIIFMIYFSILLNRRSKDCNEGIINNI